MRGFVITSETTVLRAQVKARWWNWGQENFIDVKNMHPHDGEIKCRVMNDGEIKNRPLNRPQV